MLLAERFDLAVALKSSAVSVSSVGAVVSGSADWKPVDGPGDDARDRIDEGREGWCIELARLGLPVEEAA